jgi:hypothetical protein
MTGKEVYGQRIRHTGFSPSDIVDGSQHLAQHTPSLLAEMEGWQKRTLVPAQQIAFGKAAMKLLSPIEQDPCQIMELIRPMRSADVAPTLWNTMNTVQERVMTGRLHVIREIEKDGVLQRKTVKKQAVRSIGTEVGINQALWTLAEEMAKLTA